MDFVLGVYLRGVVAVTYAALPSMQQRRTGAIVNVASEAVSVGSQGSAFFTPLRRGRDRFHQGDRPRSGRATGCAATRSRPVRSRRRCSNAAPAMLGEIGERLKQAMVNATALGRSGEPDEVAAAIAFLASDDPCSTRPARRSA